jgi:hypothetical protein
MLGFTCLSEVPLSTLSGDAIRIESSAVLDSFSSLTPTLSAIYYPQQILNINAGFLADSIVRLNSSAEINANVVTLADSLVEIISDATISSQAGSQNSAIINILNQLALQGFGGSDISSYIRTLASAELNIDGELYPFPKLVSFNSADLNVVAAFQSNFSISNPDFVYYIVYTEKVKPFNLTIVRVK